MQSKDNFSKQSRAYSRFRPVYPQPLYDFILQFVPRRQHAWDCGTGNGQAALVLSRYFEQVTATDLSAAQLSHATPAPNVHYLLARAEDTPLPDGQTDLITVAQAAHWFDFELFYKEVRRVARPPAVLALWGYGLLSIDEETDRLLIPFYQETIGAYWDKERAHIDQAYQSLPFPFREIEAPGFAIVSSWQVSDLEGYLGTWSSVQHFIAKEGYDPVPALMEKIRQHWPEGQEKEVRFPVFLRLGVVE